MNIDAKNDHHMHTVFSDGAARIEEMAAAAIERGLTTITITDHMPLPFDNRYATRFDDLDRYRREIGLAKDKYAGQLEINAGLEIEFLPSFTPWIQSIVDMGWDHLLVSVHNLFVNGEPHIVNGTRREFEILVAYSENNIENLCRTYYETMQMAVRTGWFDIVGHLDVIKKNNAGQAYFMESSPWYRSLVLETLDCVEKYKMKMEINMSGLNSPAKEQYPSRWIIQEAIKRDIPLVLSSDSHRPESLGQYFDKVDELAMLGTECEETGIVMNRRVKLVTV